jgi:flagellar biosynthesis chaperone FliJ
MDEHDPEELADTLERETDNLERQGQEVKQAVDETRADWQRKRQDDSVPGAPPPKDGEADEA